ncbi:MAG TPA: TolC family protein, partial [Candidatus Eisenbacteria bacterium]
MIVLDLLVAAVAAAAGAAAPVPAPPAPRPITLAEAVELGRDHALVVVQAEGQSRTSSAAVRSAYAAFVPAISLSTGATRQVPSTGARTQVQNGQVVILPAAPWSYNLGYTANLDLFTGGRRIFELQQAKARAGAAEVNLVTARYAATLAVKEQYFNVLAARESESATDAQVSQAEQQLHASILRLRSLTVTRSDSLRSEIQLRNALLSRMDARVAREVAEASL